MEKGLIKQWLLQKKPKAYTVIVHVYYDKLSNLKTALFIEWLAEELNVPFAAINKSSMSSALRRYRKNKVDRQVKQIKNKSPFDDELPEGISFH